jgi:AraC-like DNA-binding protein
MPVRPGASTTGRVGPILGFVNAIWPPVTDPLGEALHALRMDSSLYTRSEFSAPWGLELPPMPGHVTFHAVTSGRCWLEVEGDEPRPLQPGDLALVSQGLGHRLVSEPGAPAAALFDLPREVVSERYEILRHGGGGAPTAMMCGVVRFDQAAAHHLVKLLPAVIVVDGWTSPQMDWVQSTLRFMTHEAGELKPGGEIVVTRLADILVVQAIRTWIAQDPVAQTGWLGALRDPQVGHAIALVHRHPERDWTLEALAAEVAMSRSAFAARFTERVGEPAIRYVARFKMHVAQAALKQEGARIAELASRLGYRSEAAFSRAFKRVIGVPPGAVQREAAGTGPGHPSRT